MTKKKMTEAEAWAAYMKASAPAWKAYKKATASAHKAYLKALDEEADE